MTRFHYQPWHAYEPRWHYRIRPSTYVIGALSWVALIEAAVLIGGWLG